MRIQEMGSMPTGTCERHVSLIYMFKRGVNTHPSSNHIYRLISILEAWLRIDKQADVACF